MIGALYALTLVGFVSIRAHYRGIWVPVERQGRAEPRERLLTSGIVLSQAVPALLWLGSDALDFAAIHLPLAVQLGGFALASCGLVLLGAVHAALGANFSPRLELRQAHTLTRTGPYARIRHPMYTSGFLLVIGQGLLTANLVVLLLPLVMLTVLVVVRLPDEEAMMRERFGEEYQAYMRQTGRLLPPLR